MATLKQQVATLTESLRKVNANIPELEHDIEKYEEEVNILQTSNKKLKILADRYLMIITNLSEAVKNERS